MPLPNLRNDDVAPRRGEASSARRVVKVLGLPSSCSRVAQDRWLRRVALEDRWLGRVALEDRWLGRVALEDG